LACRIDVKDNVATTLAVEDAANGFRGPAFRERLLLEERAEGFETRTIDIGKARDSNWSDEEDIGVQRARILAASKGSPRSKKSGSRRSKLLA